MGEAAAWSDDGRADDAQPSGAPGAGGGAAGDGAFQSSESSESSGWSESSGSSDDAGAAGTSAGVSGRRRIREALSGLFRRSWPPQEWPLAIVVVGVALSLLVVTMDDFRPGTVLFSGCLFLAALFRLVLPDRQAGLLVLRSRIIDVLLMLIMALTILLLALLVPDLPEGGLPATSQ